MHIILIFLSISAVVAFLLHLAVKKSHNMKPGNLEIERKFLVDPDKLPITLKTKSKFIKQGYLTHDTDNTVRVRMADDKSLMTIKSKSTEDGLSRTEIEFGISHSHAFELLSMCKGDLIEKRRYFITYKKQTFEVDVFEGVNKGLIMAEIELTSLDQQVDLPEWITKEITGDKRYYNRWLSNNPFKNW